VRAQLAGEVEDRPRRAGEGQTVAVADVSMVECAAMQPDSRPGETPCRRHGDANVCCGWVGEQAPDRGGASVAEHCNSAAGEKRSCLASVGRRHRVPDQVNAAMELVKTALSKATSDFCGAQPGLHELPASHHPMLLPCQLRDDEVSSARGESCVHTTQNPPLAGGAPARSGYRLALGDRVARRRVNTSRRFRTGWCVALVGGRRRERPRSAPAGRAGRRGTSRPCERCSPPSAFRRGR
jgi:hypothetical protein